MSKSYCNWCFFFKEDTSLRLHPQLLKQGIEFHIELCDICFGGLQNRKTTMKDWLNQQVQVEFTLRGPQEKIDDLSGMLITKVSHCVLHNVRFVVKHNLQRGYVQGALQSYAFGDSSQSIRAWRDLSFKRYSPIKPLYAFMDSSEFVIESAQKFMLLNGRGFIQ